MELESKKRLNYDKFHGLGEFRINENDAVRTGNREAAHIVMRCQKEKDTLSCLVGARRAFIINEHSNYDRNSGRIAKLDDAIERVHPRR